MPPHLPDNGTREPDDDPVQDGEMASRRYSLDEAAEALGCHPMTLRRWLRTVDRDIEPEREERDRRFKWLTQQQVVMLGRRHRQGRLGEPTQDHTAARLADLERRIEELEVALAALRRPPVPPERVQVRVDTDQGEAPWRSPQPRRRVSTRPLGPVAVLPSLPDDWIAWRTFAARLGIPDRTFEHGLQPRPDRDPEKERHVRSGPLAYERGEWKSEWPGVPIKEALTPEQQEAARVYFGR